MAEQPDTLRKTIQEGPLVTLGNLHWRSSNLMKIPNADYLERLGKFVAHGPR